MFCKIFGSETKEYHSDENAVTESEFTPGERYSSWFMVVSREVLLLGVGDSGDWCVCLRCVTGCIGAGGLLAGMA